MFLFIAIVLGQLHRNQQRNRRILVDRFHTKRNPKHNRRIFGTKWRKTASNLDKILYVLIQRP